MDHGEKDESGRVNGSGTFNGSGREGGLKREIYGGSRREKRRKEGEDVMFGSGRWVSEGEKEGPERGKNE